MSNLTPAQKTAKNALSRNINSEAMLSQLKIALENKMSPEKFVRIVMTAVSKTPKLLECSQDTFLCSMLTSAALGLEPNTPTQHAYLIPYGSECQFQIGARGYVELCRRSKELEDIYAEVIYENDEWDISYSPRRLLHKPNLSGDRGKAILVYSKAEMKNSTVENFEVMTVAEVEKARYTGKSGDSPAWKNWWSEMAKKVVIKRHTKYLPLSPEIQQAINTDGSIKRKIVQDMTEVQEDEDIEDAVINENATTEDKVAFDTWIRDEELYPYLTVREKTEVQGSISKFRLDQLKDLASVRAKDAEKEADASPAKEEDGAKKTEPSKGNGVAGEKF